ncbi:hypothetical protein ES703_72568 [subsurface metagenome]
MTAIQGNQEQGNGVPKVVPVLSGGEAVIARLTACILQGVSKHQAQGKGGARRKRRRASAG